jgi:PBP1b-binding outer membrane lipoprotein LpoB
MIGAIVFILSLLVLGFCVISPATAQSVQDTAANAWSRIGVGNLFGTITQKLMDAPSTLSSAASE